mmetsp:Transcript_14316/g.23808  ORF Transcript_14316/g.23808 Transcript_14316/m.23808 type:complete len:491 (-) Transcript_14316:67-1539(-)
MMLILISSFIVLHLSAVLTVTPEVFAEWVTLNFTWNANHTYGSYLSSGKYIPENCVMAGLKLGSDGAKYVTVPRWRPGVPATLNTLTEGEDGYLLSPYPSWDMQQAGVDGNLQNVQSMIIDSKGIMWVIEVGRRNFFASNASTLVNGPGGIWFIDTATGNITEKYYFPPEVVPYNNSFLNDIVLDEARNLAYLSDSWGSGAIIVFNRTAGTSRRFEGPSVANNPGYVMVINGLNYGNNLFTTPVDGIAITEDTEAIFYTQVQGTELYRVPSGMLRNFTTTNAQISETVEYVGYKQPSDGMVFMGDTLYYGALTTSTVYSLIIGSNTPIVGNMTDQAIELTPNTTTMHWVDTFSLDPSNPTLLWFTSNKLDWYVNYTMDFNGAKGYNFRVNKLETVNDSTSSTDNTSLIIGIVVGGVVVLAFAGYVAYAVINARRDNKSHSSQDFSGNVRTSQSEGAPAATSGDGSGNHTQNPMVNPVSAPAENSVELSNA